MKVHLPASGGALALLAVLVSSPGRAQPADGIIHMASGAVTLANGNHVAYASEAGLLAVDASEAENAPEGGPPGSGEGAPVAHMSYVAYFAQAGSPVRRPIMFLWDGGPGASTIGLLAGSFAPVVVAVPRPGEAPPARPPTVGNNPDCLLDAADLVFVDAPGTGFGRIEGHDAAHRFYGIDGDATAFAHFIKRFLTVHGRIASPMFLLGHSYGTMRAAVVAHLLAGDDMPPRGIIAVSEWLNNNDFLDAAPADPGTDDAYVDALPTFAAVAWFHHRAGAPSSSLDAVLSRAQAFALGDYATALLAGSALPPARAEAVAATLASLTGIPAPTWRAAGLRIDGPAFRRLVLADPHREVGRLDARYVGPVTDPLAARADGDPFGDVVSHIVAAAGLAYERDVAGFGRSGPFSPDAAVPDLRWNEYHSTDGRPWDSFFNVVPDLAAVLTSVPGFHFLVMSGTYDLSTTLLGAEQELRHLPIAPVLRSSIDAVTYPTGHEPYADPATRHAMHDRIARFVEPAAVVEPADLVTNKTDDARR